MSDSSPVWDDEALAKLEKVPVFVRKMVRNKIEKAAAEEGKERITVEFMDAVKGKEMG